MGAARSLLFLREEELRLAQDLLYFGYRDFTAGADRILEQLGMGRAHHRVLHFVGRAPGMKVGELLAILGITKQSLGRVLQPLIDQGYVRQDPGLKDKRQRLLRLTETGEALERRLFDAQREWVLRAYREAGPEAVEGFRRVMRGLMGEEARAQFEALERQAAPGRTTPAFSPRTLASGALAQDHPDRSRPGGESSPPPRPQRAQPDAGQAAPMAAPTAAPTAARTSA